MRVRTIDHLPRIRYFRNSRRGIIRAQWGPFPIATDRLNGDPTVLPLFHAQSTDRTPPTIPLETRNPTTERRERLACFTVQRMPIQLHNVIVALIEGHNL